MRYSSRVTFSKFFFNFPILWMQPAEGFRVKKVTCNKISPVKIKISNSQCPSRDKGLVLASL
jgi:hypothetical protein